MKQLLQLHQQSMRPLQLLPLQCHHLLLEKILRQLFLIHHR
jgi:hypothetical protein